MLLIDEHSDALQGRSDKNKGSDFSELESAQNLPGISEIALLEACDTTTCHNKALSISENKL
jgi:hypothetical protein